MKVNKQQNKEVSSTFSQSENASVSVFGPFYGLKWQISLPFHIPEAWKRYPFRAEPLCIGHYRRYQPGIYHFALSLVCTWCHGGYVGGNLTLFSCKFFEKKFYCIDPQHGCLVRLWSTGEDRKGVIWYPPKFWKSLCGFSQYNCGSFVVCLVFVMFRLPRVLLTAWWSSL